MSDLDELVERVRDHARALPDDPIAAALQIESLDDDHPVLQAADALAVAADDEDPVRCRAGIAALFGGVVEYLGDSFKPAWRQLYSRWFSRVIAQAATRHDRLRERLTRYDLTDDLALYRRHRQLRDSDAAVPEDPRRIVVFSRVTVGADILLTSILLQHLHQRWPEAELVLLGAAKLAPLLGGLPGVRIEALGYTRRGRLGERLAAWIDCDDLIDRLAPDLVVNPDSRIDQLGLLPVIDDARFRLWENLQPVVGGPRSLAGLLDDWCRQVFGTIGEPVRPALGLDAATLAVRQAIGRALGPEPVLAVKLDHGGCPEKALPRSQEVELLRRCRERGWRILIDRGFGEEELANSDALMAELGWQPVDLDDSGQGLGLAVDALAPEQLEGVEVLRFHGSIAGWAAAVSVCRVAFSYDSVGQHLAVAAGTPTVIAFTGHRDPIFPVAWHPQGRAPVQMVTIPPGQVDRPQWVRRILAAIGSYGAQ